MSRISSFGSNTSTDSYTSVLSDDSYLATLKPGIDDQFQDMLSHIRVIENHRRVLRERKIQSHQAKKRDPNDVDRRLDWSPQMDADYASYKAKVNLLSAAKSTQEASEKIARKSKRADLSTQEKARNTALEDDKAWLDAAIAYVDNPSSSCPGMLLPLWERVLSHCLSHFPSTPDISSRVLPLNESLESVVLTSGVWIRAATARLGFMTKYPNALSTPSTRSHITAVEDNLNSAKNAAREIEIQKKSKPKLCCSRRP